MTEAHKDVVADAGQPTGSPSVVQPASLPRVWGGRVLTRARSVTPYLYVLPALAPLMVFVYWPLVYSVFLSFHDWNMIAPVRDFVGLDNYRELVERPDFRQSVMNTGLYLLGLIPLEVLLPLGLAAAAHRLRGRMRGVYQTVLFAPTVLSYVVVSLAWLWILNPVQGILNEVLALVGITGPNWLSDQTLGLWTIVLITAWKALGFNLVLYLAGLSTIRSDLYEAAAMDGASEWQMFWRITVPLVSPTIVLVAIHAVLFIPQQSFTPINVLTEGTNDGAINVVYSTWQYGFEYLRTGIASAAALLTFVAFAVLGVLQLRIGERYAHYVR